MRFVASTDRNIRIAHVTFGLDVGGQEKLLVEFARHADRDRFDLRFISLGDRGPLAADIESLGWQVDALGVPIWLAAQPDCKAGAVPSGDRGPM